MATVPVAKKPGPPVPPRPQHTALILTSLKAHRLDKKTGAAAAEQQLVNPVNTKTDDGEDHNAANWIAAKGGKSSGRTVIYKSPSVQMQHRQEERTRSTDHGYVGQTKKPITSEKSTNGGGVNVPKPTLKLRKAPDVPNLQLRQTSQSIQLRLKDNQKAEINNIKLNNNNNNNDVIVEQSTQVGVTRHHSMNSTQIRQPNGREGDNTIGQHRKDARFSLSSNVVNTNIHLNKLQPTTQPLLKPRKILKVPVANLDVENDNQTPTTTSHVTGISLFRRSKTTLDQFTSRANVTNISTGHPVTSGGFFSGKTVEITNNLRNAAERLFSEIIINQQKSNHNSKNLTSAHERGSQYHQLFREKQQHVATPQKQLQQQQQQRIETNNNVTVVNTDKMITTTATTQMPDLISEVVTVPSKQYANNCTRINITATNGNGLSQVLSAYNSPEKKVAFHEMLISELTAMRKKSSSMENLPIKYCKNNTMAPESKTITTESKTTPYHLSPSLDDNEEDADVDNIEDMDGDQEDNLLNKSNNILNKETLHKRSPSGCSSDSSPYGTERSARIRTSDWIEVGDNGKQVTLTSCHISLEDSGLEDEERLDDISSSGVGDSWDSVKEDTEQETKRYRTAKGIINTIDLPPMPESLNGLECGLISNVDKIAAAIKTMSVEKNSTTTTRNDLIMKNVNKNNNNGSNGTSSPREMTEDENQNHDYLNNNDKDRNKLLATFTTPAISTNYDNSKTLATAAVITKALHEINDKSLTTISDVPPAIPGSKLDNQIATLRKEMFGLRQLDISLLSQLWTLNDSIQEFRTMIQNQDQEEDETYSTHSHSPSPYDSVSSEAEDEVITLNAKKLMDTRLTPPSVITKQPRLKKLYSADDTERLTKGTIELTLNKQQQQQQQQQQQKPVTNSSEIKPMPRMRSAPPPPPTQYRKSQPAPPRPT